MSLASFFFNIVTPTRPKEFPKYTYDDEEEGANPRDLPPSDSEDEV